MKHLLLFFNFIIASIVIYGQTTIKQSSLAPGGGISVADTQQLLYTVGESFVSENDLNNLHLSEGFINPAILNSLGLENDNKLTGVTIFPVPVHDKLNINLSKTGKYEIYLLDVTGKQILLHRLLNQSKLRLHTTAIRPGNYLLVIVRLPSKSYYVQKIIKL